MPRALPLVLLLLAAAAVAVLAWSPWAAGDPTGPSAGAGAGIGAVHGAGDASAAAADTAARAGAAAVDQGPRDPDPAAGRREAATTPGGRPVLVVDAATRSPVPDAIVRCERPIDPAALSPHERESLQDLLARDVEQFLERTGRETTTDANGRCTVRLEGTGHVHVTARSGADFAMQVVLAEQTDEIVLALRPDRTLRVLAVDARGAPAPGVLIECAGIDAATHDLDLGRTDADGRVERRHAQAALADGESSRRVRLRALAPGAVSAPAEIDLADPPAEVVLRLPATGTVAVRVLEADGAPLDPRWLDDPFVRLTAISSADRDGPRPTSFAAGPERARLGPDGVATFSFVGLDRELIARQDDFSDARKFAGPTLEQPHVEVALRRSEDGLVLTGRLLGPDGAPVPDVRWRLTFRHDRGAGSIHLRTAAGGRFRVHLGIPFARRELALRFASDEGGAADGKPAVLEDGARRPLGLDLAPRLVGAGVHDLGDLRLEPFRCLVAGRFARDAECTAAAPRPVIERRLGDRWVADNDLGRCVRVPAVDRFELWHALPPGTPLRVRIPDGPWLPVPPIETAAGAAELEIPLRAAGTVAATFVGDAATPIERFTYRLARVDAATLDELPPAGDRARDALFGGPRAADGRLQRTWPGLAPGTYRLLVRCPGVDEPLLRLDGLRVGTGVCDDPRLSAIDLRGLARRILVRAFGADGNALPDQTGWVLPLGSDGSGRTAVPIRGGMAEVFAPGAVDVLVTAKGHAPLRLAQCAGEVAARLSRAEVARVAVVLPAPLPAGVVLSLRAEPVPAGAGTVPPAGGDVRSLGVFLEIAPLQDGVVALPVRMPGPHRLAAVLDGWLPVEGVEPATVDLAGGATVRVAIPEPALRAAIARLPK